MSHSKRTKHGNSYYVECQNPAAKRFIVTCALCASLGYSPSIDDEEFLSDPINRVIASELRATLKPLALDDLGRCETCASVMDKKA